MRSERGWNEGAGSSRCSKFNGRRQWVRKREEWIWEEEEVNPRKTMGCSSLEGSQETALLHMDIKSSLAASLSVLFTRAPNSLLFWKSGICCDLCPGKRKLTEITPFFEKFSVHRKPASTKETVCQVRRQPFRGRRGPQLKCCMLSWSLPLDPLLSISVFLSQLAFLTNLILQLPAAPGLPHPGLREGQALPQELVQERKPEKGFAGL